MSRENYFLEKENGSKKAKSRRKVSAERIKQIYIQKLGEEEMKPLQIAMNKTVKDLKKEIEKLYNLSYSLNDHFIRVATNGMKEGSKPIDESNEGKTLFENHFTSECLVTFGKETNEGGQAINILNKFLNYF